MLLLLLFLYIPSGFLVNYFSLTILKRTFEIKRLAYVAIAQGIVLMVLRDLFGLMGAHIIIQSFSHVLLYVVILGVSPLYAIMARGFGLLAVIISELFFVSPILHILGISPMDSLGNTGLHLAVGWLAYAPIVGGVLLLAKRSATHHTIKEGDAAIEAD